MYHLRLKGSHYEMGVKRGKIFNKCNITFPLSLDDFQRKYGYESEKQLQKFFPEVCEEIKGVTDTIRTDYQEFAAWLLCMGCCMYNLESNIPVEIRGCTAFAFSDNNRFTAEITIYRPICVKAVKVKFIPRPVQINLTLQLLLS